MKIKGGGCVGLCQGFNPNESRCQCYGCQKPCGGGRRACGRRELYGGCCGCDEPPPETCDKCSEKSYILLSEMPGGNVTIKTMFQILSNTNNTITAFPVKSGGEISKITIDEIKITLFIAGSPTPSGSPIFTNKTNAGGKLCFNTATDVTYPKTVTCL